MGGTADLDPAAKAQGWLTAIDAATGAVRWKYRSARPMVGGGTATAAGAKSALDPTNSDHVGWIKRFDDQLASCGR